ncbi:peptidoglycan DD-metalloendopeptidase family protein [Actinomycetaceae bacterium L2_0104]
MAHRTGPSELPRRRQARRDEAALTPRQLELARRMEAESARRKALREATRSQSRAETMSDMTETVREAAVETVSSELVESEEPAVTVHEEEPAVTVHETEILTPEVISAAVSEGLRISRVELRRRERLAAQQRECTSEAAPRLAGRESITPEHELHALPTAAKPASLPKYTAPRTRPSRSRVLQGMTVSALAVAGVAVPVLGNFGAGQAQASQPLTASLLSAGPQEVQTPASLAGTPTAGIRSSAFEASEQAKANPVNAQCSPEGAQGLRTAFVQDQQNVVVFPLSQGTFHRTSPFGPRIDPFGGGSSYHAGQDYAADDGTPIYAIADGVVVHAGGSYQGRSNNTIVVRHEIDGKVYESWYVHMYDHGVLVKEGDRVEAGQTIGLVGSNGNSTGPHLHLEIHDPSLAEGGDLAVLLNPDDFLAEHGAVDLSEMCG